MSKIVKLMTAVAFAAIAHMSFAYNDGYENSLICQTLGDGRFGNDTIGKGGVTVKPTAAEAKTQMYAQCRELRSVDLSSLTELGDAAFAYSALTSVELPSTLKSMGYIAFGGCTNLASITINSTGFMTSADENKEPFRDCTALKTVIAKCAPPSWDFKKVFPVVTAVKVPQANLAAWQAKEYDGVTIKASDATYTIRYNSNDGLAKTKEQDAEVGKTQTLYYMSSQIGWTREGYTFSGWGRTPSSTGVAWINGNKVKDIVAGGETIDLYAVWKKKTSVYTVNYYKNDGTTAKTGQVLETGETQPLIYMASQLGWARAGYTFAGWGKSPTATTTAYINGNKVKDLAAPGKTVNLYAIWKKSSSAYTVNYYKNDGTTARSGQVLAVGETQPLIYMASQLGWARKGYTFAGWGKTATATTTAYINGQKVKDLAAPGKTVNLYAIWKKSSSVYTVNYYKNDGTTLKSGQVLAVGETQPLIYLSSQLGWIRSGYAFAGWSKSPTATTATYTNGHKVKDLAPAGKSVNLYAVWTKKTAAVAVRPSVVASACDQDVPAFEPGYYRGTFANGIDAFDLIIDEDGGVFFAAWTEDGHWAEEAKAEQIGDVLVLTFEDGQLVLHEENGVIVAE